MINFSSSQLIKLGTEKNSPLLIQQAREYFLWLGINMVWYAKTEDSLVGRYLISKELEKIWMKWYLPTGQSFSCGDLFFSTSHSKGMIFFALAYSKIAVDVEKIITRDSSLLSQISDSLFSPWIERYGKWEVFYLQRCARECCVKLLNLSFSVIETCKILEINEKYVKVWYKHQSYDFFYQFDEEYCFVVGEK